MRKTEFERRFIVTLTDDIRLCSSEQIVQAYFDTPRTREMRLRAIDGDKYVLAAKFGKGAARGEDEIVLKDEDAAAWFFRNLQDSVAKTRYRRDGWEIDVFAPPLQNLVVAEIERRRPVKSVRFPRWMANPVEITDSLSSRAFARIATEIKCGLRAMPDDPRRLAARLPVIVITGGPCSGKTTVMEGLKKIFAGRVHFLPETASIVIGQAGISLVGRNETDNAPFQRTIYTVQCAFEEGAMLQAQIEGAAALVVDRGTLDGAAYMAKMANWELAIGTTATIESRRYDGIVFLTNPGKRSFVANRANNPNRYEETYEQVVQTSSRTLLAWEAARNKLHIVHPAKTIDRRIEEAADWIRRIAKI